MNTVSLVGALDLKCMFTHVSKGSDLSMEEYLHHIKSLTDYLATIQSLVSKFELIHFATASLPPDYHTIVTTYSILPGSYTFND